MPNQYLLWPQSGLAAVCLWAHPLRKPSGCRSSLIDLIFFVFYTGSIVTADDGLLQLLFIGIAWITSIAVIFCLRIMAALGSA